jgi:hypothetical protein
VRLSPLRLAGILKGFPQQRGWTRVYGPNDMLGIY